MNPHVNDTCSKQSRGVGLRRAGFCGSILLVGTAQLATAPAVRAGLLPGAAWPPLSVALNEVRTDQPGTDNDEFVELVGPPDLSLDGYFLVVIGDGEGLSGCIEEIVDLSGHAVGVDGCFLVAQPQMTTAAPDLVTPLELENSDNLTLLLVHGFAGWLEQDLDLDDDGSLDLAPWTMLLDAVSMVESVSMPPSGTEWWYASPIGPGGNGDPPFLIRRCSSDGQWSVGPNDPGQGVDTPGTPNAPCVAAPPCPADLNSDSVVDAIDLAILLVDWGPAGAEIEGGGPADTDLNADGLVDAGDLGILLASWPGCG